MHTHTHTHTRTRTRTHTYTAHRSLQGYAPALTTSRPRPHACAADYDAIGSRAKKGIESTKMALQFVEKWVRLQAGYVPCRRRPAAACMCAGWSAADTAARVVGGS